MTDTNKKLIRVLREAVNNGDITDCDGDAASNWAIGCAAEYCASYLSTLTDKEKLEFFSNVVVNISDGSALRIVELILGSTITAALIRAEIMDEMLVGNADAVEAIISEDCPPAIDTRLFEPIGDFS